VIARPPSNGAANETVSSPLPAPAVGCEGASGTVLGVTAFESGLVVHTGEDIASSEYAKLLSDVPALRVTLADPGRFDEVAAKLAGVVAVMKAAPGVLHLIVGEQAGQLARVMQLA